jgi:hypothetical protein
VRTASHGLEPLASPSRVQANTTITSESSARNDAPITGASQISLNPTIALTGHVSITSKPERPKPRRPDNTMPIDVTDPNFFNIRLSRERSGASQRAQTLARAAEISHSSTTTLVSHHSTPVVQGSKHNNSGTLPSALSASTSSNGLKRGGPAAAESQIQRLPDNLGEEPGNHNSQRKSNAAIVLRSEFNCYH